MLGIFLVFLGGDGYFFSGGGYILGGSWLWFVYFLWW